MRSIVGLDINPSHPSSLLHSQDDHRVIGAGRPEVPTSVTAAGQKLATKKILPAQRTVNHQVPPAFCFSKACLT